MEVSYDLFSKIKIPEFLQDEMKQIMSFFNLFNESQKIMNYLIQKERKIKFESETGKITADSNGGGSNRGSISGSNNNNNSRIFTISKYLFLLSLFLF